MTTWDTMSPSNGLSLDPQRLWHWLQVKLWRVDGGRSWSDVCQVDPWRKPSGDDARSWRYQCQWSKLLVCSCFCHLGVANTIDDIWECNACIDPYVLFVIHVLPMVQCNLFYHSRCHPLALFKGKPRPTHGEREWRKRSRCGLLG